MTEITPQKVRELLAAATPGPWMDGTDELEIWAARDPAEWDAFMVATTRTRLNPDGGHVARSDTELIVAAPDIARAYLEAMMLISIVRMQAEEWRDEQDGYALVLDPFAGSGTTVEAAILEGFHWLAIEREPDYLPLITQRIKRRRDPIAYLTTAGEDLGLFGEPA